MTTDDDEVVHLVGPDICWQGTHVRQRCSWCGYVLVDADLTRVAVQIPADGSDPGRFPTWEVGAFVAVAGARGSVRVLRVVEVEEEGKAPPGNCMELPPELTLAVEAPEVDA